jgi:hypothetical protein
MMEPNPPAPTETDPAARIAELEERIASIEATARARLIEAELRTQALQAGLFDLDGLKLADTSSIAITDHGEVTGAETVLTELKRAKPWLFSTTQASSTAHPPPARPPKPKLATEMGYDEWRAARAELLRRR